MRRLLPLWFVAALLSVWLPSVAQITPYPWVAIGPRGDLASAKQIPGVNGRMRSIQIIPNESSYSVYIGACGGGLWRANGLLGPVWANLGDQLPNPSVGALAVSPSNLDDILVGTGDYSAYPPGGIGLFHTTDAGASPWTPVDLPVTPTYFFRLLYLPGNPNIVLAATDAGLFRSAAGAAGPWTNVLGGWISDLVIDPSNPQIQYCAKYTSGNNDGGIYKSTDGGMSWQLISAGVAPANNFGQARIAICRDAPNMVAFVHEWTNFIWSNVFSGVALSTNGGTNWSDITPANLAPLNTEEGRALAITFRPNNPQEIIVAANNIWRTFNDGQVWYDNLSLGNSTDTIKPHQDIAQLYFSSLTGDDILWQCSDGGVFQVDLSSNNKISWNGASNALTSLQVSTVADMDALRQIRVIGNQDDQTAATANDGSWTSVGDADCYAVAITQDLSVFPFTPAYWYIGSSGGNGTPNKVTIGNNSRDFGDSIVLIPYCLFYNRFEDELYGLDANANLVSRIASSTASGSWTTELNLPPGTGGLRGDRVNGQTLYVWGASKGVLTVLQKHGGSWSVLRNAPIGVSNNKTNSVTDVFASTEWPGQCWAIMSGPRQLLYTSDYWQTWTTNVSGNLNDVTTNSLVRCLAVMPFNPAVMFVGTDQGVFATEDGGTTWQPFQTGMPIGQCTRLKFATDYNHSGQNMLVAATFGHGLYERLISRPPLVYVDQRVTSSYQDCSFEHPTNSLSGGLATTPPGGMMALDGATVYTTSGFLNQPMTITAYEFPAFLTH